MASLPPEARNDGAQIHEPGQDVSSIGPKWPPARASAERIKGFYTPGPLNTLEQFKNDFFPSFEEYLNSPLFGEESEHGYSRISMRAVVSNDLVYCLHGEYRPFVEAIIPLSGSQPAFENHSIVYFGVNHQSRRSDDHRLEQNWANLDMALQRRSKNPQEIIQKPYDLGYSLEVIESMGDPDEALVQEVFQLIKRFKYDVKDTHRILADPTFTLGVARKDGNIVAVGLAETNEIQIGEDMLTLVELTEASTDQNHLHKGLYSGIATTLLQYLAQRSSEFGFNSREADMIYGESNGSAPGVLITAAYQGRTFATDVCNQFGYEGKGMLPLHVPILDPDEDSANSEIKRNNNLFPTYISREKLYQLYS
jgi:hypothetical protein